MTPEQGRALDRQLTTPPRDCDEEGHDWHFIGYEAGEARPYYRCRRCGQESER